ncbi:PAS domain-containing sensor histidine kinase [Luteimonas vadosa]|uniref:histidine kinase n=1 Tax=Luteimonas vadosa TaxID=1165507 RepID=A0ABP9DYW0_9GAMM
MPPATPEPVKDSDFRLLVEAVADYGIFMLDPEGCVRTWNRGLERLKGYTADEIIGRHFSVFYPEARRAERWPQQELEFALRDGSFEDEGWRVRKDGTHFWANVVITALRGEDGRHRGFAKVTRDLTERRVQEELLRQSEERFRLMVEGVRDYAIFMLDPDGRIASWNLGAQITKGYTAEEVIGRHFSIFYPKDKRDARWPEHELECAVRDGRFEDVGWRLRKDGTRFWANVVITALFDEKGRHRGFCKVTRDLTEARRIDALEEHSRQLTQFLAVLGHELRNPLAPIVTTVEMMRMAPAAGDPADPFVGAREILARQVGQLCRLVDDLLDVGRIASGKIHIEHEPVLLQDVVDQAVEATAPHVEAGRHVLEVDLPEHPLRVDGDRARLVQVVSNLLHNATKFSPPGGRIRVWLARAGGNAELGVADNGPGIPPEDLQYIFRLFAQAGGDMSQRTHDGLGVGLSLVHRLVSDHGGQVSAFSTGKPGEGAEFIVSLPLVGED